jgi:hypothetical protein
MGLIRKSLHIATAGVVAPNSKKQRVQRQILAAVQGQSPAQVRRAGGRYEHSLATVGMPTRRVARKPYPREREAPSAPPMSMDDQRSKSQAAYEAWKAEQA